MKKKVTLLALILVASVFILKKSESKSDSNTTTKNDVVKKSKTIDPVVGKVADLKVVPAKKEVSKNSVTIKDHNPERLKELAIEYKNTLIELNQYVKDNSFDMSSFLQESTEKGFEVALNNLPAKHRAAFAKLHVAAKNMQDEQIRLDGASRDDLKPHKVYKPKWVEEREVKLKSVSLNQQVQGRVDSLKIESSITNSDVTEIISLCQNSKDCVDKAFYELINANHQLNDHQLTILKETKYL